MGNSCNGGHVYAKECRMYLGLTTEDECGAACVKKGSGCCELGAFRPSGTGGCNWKADPSVDNSAGHTDTNAIVCTGTAPTNPHTNSHTNLPSSTIFYI